MRIVVASSEVQRTVGRYYRRAPARIVLALPLGLKLDALLRFAVLEAYDAEGAEAETVIPLAFLGKDALAAVYVELRDQLDNPGASANGQAKKPE